MRPSTVLTTAAAAVSAQDLASLSSELAALTTDPAYSSLVSVYATADPTSLYNSVAGYADSALASLSDIAATATGSDASYYSGLYTSAAAALSSADAQFSGATATAGGAGASATASSGGSGSSSGNNNNNESGASSGSSDSSSESSSASSDVAQQSGNGAMATAVPVAMGAVGMAVLGML